MFFNLEQDEDGQINPTAILSRGQRLRNPLNMTTDGAPFWSGLQGEEKKRHHDVF